MSRESARRVLREEAEALLALADRLGEEIETAVEWLLACRGRAIACGVGKSGHIARKTAGTLASTGTPSLFLHAAEAAHGDLGMVTEADVVLLYSYSGETEEIVRLLPALKATGARIIAVTGRRLSSLGQGADLVLDAEVSREACPNNLAPTTSTTAMLALSDALAVATMERRAFTQEDFARFHPAGTLGKRLLLTVADVMRAGEDLPTVAPETPVSEVMRVITKAGAGAACVMGPGGELRGLISDGDLRRHILAAFKGEAELDVVAELIMSAGVLTIAPEILAFDALEAFGSAPKKIGEMPVVREGRVVGLLVLKDLLRIGIV